MWGVKEEKEEAVVECRYGQVARTEAGQGQNAVMPG